MSYHYEYDYTNPFGNKKKPGALDMPTSSNFKYSNKNLDKLSSLNTGVKYSAYSKMNQETTKYSNNPIKYYDDALLIRKKDEESSSSKDDYNPIKTLNFNINSSLDTKNSKSKQNIKPFSKDDSNPIKTIDYDFNSRLDTTNSKQKRTVKPFSKDDSNPIKTLDYDFNSHQDAKNSKLKQHDKLYFDSDDDSDSDDMSFQINYNDKIHQNENKNIRSDGKIDNTYQNDNTFRKRKVGEMIFVGKKMKTFQYLGMSGNFILAIDSAGTIHRIPNDVYVI